MRRGVFCHLKDGDAKGEGGVSSVPGVVSAAFPARLPATGVVESGSGAAGVVTTALLLLLLSA